MKLSVAFLSIYASVALAKAQGTVSNDLIQGGCKAVTLVYARASTETGNMGTTNSVGPGLCKGLKKNFRNDVACQGVSKPAYSAGLMDNVSAAGTTQSAIAEATKHIRNAADKCPNTIIVAGGFSQGTAVIFNAVSKLPADLKERVVGVALYGYTKNKQNSGGIPNYPKERVIVFCPPSDGVCGGKLAVNAGHFTYLTGKTQQEGYTFLTKQINAAKAGGGSTGAKSPKTPKSPKAPKAAKGAEAEAEAIPEAAAEPEAETAVESEMSVEK